MEKEAKKPEAEIEKSKEALLAKGRKARKMIKKHKKESPTAEILKKKAIEYTFLTMKDLIGLVHVKPTKLTSAVVGAKYPKTQE